MAENEINNKVVVIGGSAGSLEIILDVVSKLPADSYATFIIVLHRKSDSESLLENLIASRTHLDVKEVEDKDHILPNTIYIAPPDYHLLVENEHSFSLDISEKVNYSRPSIDVTFESVADVFRNRAIAVLLSGANADGAKGVATIKKMGGYVVVQNPGTAEVGFMPQQAINMTKVDKIVNAQDIAATVLELLSA